MVNRYHRGTKIPEHIVMTLSTLELYKDVKYCNYIVPRSTANTRWLKFLEIFYQTISPWLVKLFLQYPLFQGQA